MDQQPKIPTLKDAQKPQVKIKGMGAGLTLFDRLKQFKKKDLAFILAGLGTLFMAPLAEHFMMAPENGDANLQQGWGKGGGAGNLFGGGSSPYENGNNNIASGGAIGGSGDIITPLNVRDPSALVMGPGGTQQPNAGSAVPAAPPPTAPARSETDYKDALAGAASRAASAAVKRAPLPVPKIAVGGSGLRGLGVAGGGTSASGSLGPIGPAAGSTGGGGGSGLNLVRNAPGFRSAAGARSPTGGTGLDGTKKAGANAGDAFSRTGSALSGLNAAASEQIPTGGQGFGGGGAGGAGANDKPYSGSGPGGSKSVGESLAFLEAKQRMEENLKLEFEKRKLKDPELLLYGIRNDSLKAMAAEMTKSLTKGILGFMDPSSGPGADTWQCGPFNLPKSYRTCATDKPDTDCIGTIGGRPNTYVPYGGGAVTHQCVSKSGKGDPSAGATETAASTPPAPTVTQPTSEQATAMAGLTPFCIKLQTSEAMIQGVIDASSRRGAVDTGAADLGAKNKADLAVVSKMLTDAKKLGAAKAALFQGGKNECLDDTATKVADYDGKTPASKLYEQTVAALAGDGKSDKGGIGILAAETGGKDVSKIADAKTKTAAAEEALKKATILATNAGTMVGEVGTFTTLGGNDAALAELVVKANASKAALAKIVEADKTLSTQLTPLITGTKLAGVDDGNSAKQVIEKNKDFAAKEEEARKYKKDLALAVNAPAAPQTGAGATTPAAPAQADWSAKKTEVETKVKEVVFTILDTKLTEAKTAAEAAATAKPEEKQAKEKAAKDAADAAATELQTVYDKVTAMQASQTDFLTGLRTGVEKAGRPEAAATPTVAAK